MNRRKWTNFWCDRRTRREHFGLILVLVVTLLWFNLVGYANEVKLPTNGDLFTLKEILAGWAKTIAILVGAILSLFSFTAIYIVNDLKSGQRRIEDKLDLKVDVADCDKFMYLKRQAEKEKEKKS